MAKLSANGTEILRVTRERDLTGRTSWERETYSVRSTGAILQKNDYRWSDGQRHSSGWSHAGRVEADKTVSQLAAEYGQKGFTVEYSSILMADLPIVTSAQEARKECRRARSNRRRQERKEEWARQDPAPWLAVLGPLDYRARAEYVRASCVRQLDRYHVGNPYREVRSFIRTKVPPSLWEVPIIRRAIVRAALLAHRANRRVYREVMGFAPAPPESYVAKMIGEALLGGGNA